MTTYIHIADPRVAHFDLLVYPSPGETVIVHIDDADAPPASRTHRTKTYTSSGPASETAVVTGPCSCP